MTRLHKIAAALVVCGLVPLAGCTRTSDGTLVIKKPPSLTTLLPANPFRKKREAHAPVAASQFPPVPRQPAGAGQMKTKQARRKPVAATDTLACLNQTKPGDRVRVVCD
jgi:hypothetical protein